MKGSVFVGQGVDARVVAAGLNTQRECGNGGCKVKMLS